MLLSEVEKALWHPTLLHPFYKVCGNRLLNALFQATYDIRSRAPRGRVN